MAKRFVHARSASLLLTAGAAVGAAAFLAGFAPMGLQTDRAKAQASPYLATVSEPYDPCGDQIFGSNAYIVCQDRAHKIQRLEDSQRQRDQVYEPQVQSFVPPPPQAPVPPVIVNMPTTPSLFNDAANAAAANAAAQNR